MFKDAILFHVQLFVELDKAGLTLKDALPNNIVFNHTSPVFVDFLPLVLYDLGGSVVCHLGEVQLSGKLVGKSWTACELSASNVSSNLLRSRVLKSVAEIMETNEK